MTNDKLNSMLNSSDAGLIKLAIEWLKMEAKRTKINLIDLMLDKFIDVALHTLSPLYITRWGTAGDVQHFIICGLSMRIRVYNPFIIKDVFIIPDNSTYKQVDKAKWLSDHKNPSIMKYIRLNLSHFLLKYKS